MVRIATAEVEVHGDTKPFIADLESLKAIVEKFDKLSVNVHAKLAPRTRASLQRQLKELAPPLTVKVRAKLTGLDSLGKVLANHAGILAEENQLNDALRQESIARRELANATAAQARAVTAGLNSQRAALALEAQRLRLARQQEAAIARQARFLRDHRNILGLELREWRFLSQQILGFNRNLDVTRKAFLLNAAASETLLGTLVKVFKRAVDLRKVATQLGATLGAGFAAAAQATGALVSGLGRAVTAAGVLAGIGLISIGVKLQLNDAEVKASLDNLKNTFTGVFTRASASLKPVLQGFFSDISAGLLKQEGAFKSFFDKISGPLGRVGKSLSDILASESFTKLIGKIGDVTASFLDKVADKLPAIFEGAIKIGEEFVKAGKRIRDAFGPGIFSGLSTDGIIRGIRALTDALVSAGAGVRAFKKAFGEALGGVGIALKGILAEIGKSGPALFGALGPILRALAIDIGKVVQALIRFASVVLPIAKDAIIGFADAFSTNLSKALDILAKPLGETVKNISILGQKLSPLLPILAQIAANLEPVIAGITRFGIAISPALVELARFVEKFSAGLGQGLQPFIDGLVKLGEIISKVLTPALKFLNDHGITQFLGQIAGGVIGVLAFIAVMKSLGSVLGIFTKKDKGKTAALLAENVAMGKGSRLARIFKGALGALGGAAKNVGNIFKSLFGKFADTKFGAKLLDQFKLLKTGIGVKLIEAGDAIKGFASKIGDFFKGIGSKIAAPFEGVATKIKAPFTSLVKFFAGLRTRIVNVFSGIGAKITGFFKGIKIPGLGALGETFGGLGTRIGAALAPLGKFLGLLGRFAGIVGIAIFLIQNWRTLWDALKQSLDTIVQTFESVIAGIKRIGTGISELFHGDFAKGFGDIFGGLGDILLGILKGVFAGLKGSLSTLWTLLWSFLEDLPILGGLFEKLHKIISDSWNRLKGVFTDLFSNFSLPSLPDFSNIFSGLKTAGSEALSFVAEKISGLGNTLSGIGGSISGAFSTIGSTIRSLVGGAIDFVSGKIGGLVSKLAEIGGKIKALFTGGDSGKAVASEASNQAADQVRIQSEAILKALAELGPKVQAELQKVTAIIAQGFVGLGTAIGTAVTGISTQVATALTGLATTMATTLTTIFTTVLTTITTQTTVVLTTITTLATTLVTTLTTTLSTVATTLTTVFAGLSISLVASFTAIFAGLQAQATAFFTATLPATVQGGIGVLTATLTTGLSAAFTTAFAAVGPIIQSSMDAAFANAAGAAANGMAGVVAAVSGGVSAIIAAVAPLADQLPAFFDTAFARALSSAQKGVDNIVNAVKSGVDRIRALGPAYFAAGQYIGQQLADGMNSKVEAVRQAATNLAKAAKAPMPSSPAKEGPLSGHGDPLFSGREIVNRLVRGIEERRDTVAAVINQIAAVIRNGTARAGLNVNIPSGNVAINSVLDAIRKNQDPLARAIDRLNITLGTLPDNLNRGLALGLGAVGGPAAGTGLTGRFDKSIKGSILKQDTSAQFGGNGSSQRIGGNIVQIRPGQINLTLAGIRDPKAFLDELSRELLTMVKGK